MKRTPLHYAALALALLVAVAASWLLANLALYGRTP